MAESNFQDVIVLSSDSLQVRGQAISVGTDAGVKSIILANDVGALSMAANPSTTRTITIPDANGTLGLITAISAGTTLASNGAVILSNSNGISFGANGNTITASYTQSVGPAAISAGTTLGSSGTIVFSNSNAISFGMNGNTVTASFSQTVTPAVFGIGVSTGGNTAGNTGTTLGTYVLAGAGGITLSQSTAAGSPATVSISMTQSTAPGGIAAGSQTATSGTVLFSNSNGISFGMSNSSVVTASFDGIRSISAGTTFAVGPQIVFSNSNGVSFGVNGSTVTASIDTSPAQRVTLFSQWAEFGTNMDVRHGSLSIQKVSFPMHLAVTEAVVALMLSGNSGSSGALTINLAVYTLSQSTASLASSGSRQISWTSGSATSASSLYGGVSGTRYRTIGINVSLTPGDYLLAYNMSTSNDGSWRVFGRQGLNLVGVYDGIETSYFLDGVSASSVTAFPASIVATNTNYVRTGLAALRQPGAIMLGSF